MKKIQIIMFTVCVLLFSVCKMGFAQKLDKEFRSFYKGFQRNLEANNQEAITQICYFPLQTLYWIDGVNNLSDEEKADGLIEQEDFATYDTLIFNATVRELVPQVAVDQVQQIDVAASGDYYKRLGKLIDQGSTLLELYCTYGDQGALGDRYFAFIFGRVQGEYRVLAYYTTERVKK